MRETDLKDIRCLTPQQIGELLGLNKNTVYRLTRTGIIPAFKLNNGKWRYPLKKIKELIEKKMNSNIESFVPKEPFVEKPKRDKIPKSLKRVTLRDRVWPYNRETGKYEYIDE